MFNKINQGQWWDQGWKLIEGCTPISEDCLNCWSRSMEKRFRKETGIMFHPERFKKPFYIKKPTAYAIWNDLFHESVFFEWIDIVITIIALNPQHIFHILTKRPDKMFEYFKSRNNDKSDIFDYMKNICWDFSDLLDSNNMPRNWYFDRYIDQDGFKDIELIWEGNWPLENLWLGVTCESKNYIRRIHELLKIPAKIHFVSFEPLLSEIYIPKRILNTIKWVIAGPETGPGKRPYKKEWIESLYEQCKSANVPFFDKKNILGKNIKQYPI
jgi:protein gp37